MRARLTLAFACFVLAITIVGGTVRSAALADEARESAVRDLTSSALILGHAAADVNALGQGLTADRLAAYVPANTEMTLVRNGSAPIVVPGPGFDAGDPDEPTQAQVRVGSYTVRLLQDAEVLAADTANARQPLFLLLSAIVLGAGLLGFIVASMLARPFDRLAKSAAALGRGRFDLLPPTSRIPEVAAVGEALRTSAKQLEDSLQRDREFFQHASHALRTPLTALRLELEELTLHSDLSDDARRTALRSLGDAERLQTTVSELLEFARARSLVAGAEVTLLSLGSDIAQRWRARLPDSRPIQAYVDSGADVRLTPGPVEQLLDTVLRDVSEHADGTVLLTFAGEDEVVRIKVGTGGPRRGTKERPRVPVTQTLVEVLGGRCTGDVIAGELDIVLPRR